MPRILIVSNRLPVKITGESPTFTLQTSEGGLATGLGAIYTERDTIWLGWPGTCAGDETEQKEMGRLLAEKKLYPVHLTQAEINLYYEGFSNEILWPVFHYMATYARYDTQYWDAYTAVNAKFCEALLALYQPGDIIWIHDYQLLLLAKLVRKEKPAA
ncbi:MAG: bifunctional alpha,alpha-trehalose-phosphate synthase (UDP-forming)/trehalose-phosphatase, partial [Chitinophagaceae bacterium]